MGSTVGAAEVGRLVAGGDGSAEGSAVGAGEGPGVRGTVTLIPKTLEMVWTPSLGAARRGEAVRFKRKEKERKGEEMVTEVSRDNQ